MRGIEFRGIDKQTGKWVLGSLLIREEESPVPETTVAYKQYFIVNGGFENHEYEIIPETVGQFTGLLDKNGVKIFEGDFIKRYSWSGKTDPYEYRAAIFFEKGCFLIKKPDTCYRSGFDPNGSSLYEEIRHIEELKQEYPKAELYIEVIGNIHDNPGLLK